MTTKSGIEMKRHEAAQDEQRERHWRLCECCQTEGGTSEGFWDVYPTKASKESITLCEECQEAFIHHSALPASLFEDDVIGQDAYTLLAEWVKAEQPQPEAEPNNAGQSQPTGDYYDGGSAQDGKEFKEFFISQPPNCIAVFPERLGSSKAHRDFVLRAVNSHAELVAACQALRGLFAGVPNEQLSEPSFTEKLDPVFEQLLTALSKAGVL